MINVATDISAFLSHLCGGEGRFINLAAPFIFLSHLCGGEVTLIKQGGEGAFLSHLCGGEECL